MLDKATTFVYIGEVEQNSNDRVAYKEMSGSQTFYPNIIMSNRHQRLYLFVFIIFVFKNTFFVFWKWQIVLPTCIFFFWVHCPFYSLWSLGKVQFYKILASSSWVSLTLVTRGIHTITMASHYTSEMWRFFIPGNPFTWSEITLSSAAGTGGSYGWHQKWRLTSTRDKPSQSNKEWFGCKVWHQVKVHRFNSQRDKDAHTGLKCCGLISMFDQLTGMVMDCRYANQGCCCQIVRRLSLVAWRQSNL